MPHYEYKVVPAPTRGVKAKGVKGTQARFAHALETVMNDLGAQGWEYQRTDTLPVEERQGLRGTTSTFQNMLVFRRALTDPTPSKDVAVGLIEDQSDQVPEAPTPVEAPEDPMAQAEVKADEPLMLDTSEQVAETPSEPTPDAQAAETQTPEGVEGDTPPFAFPWNRKPLGKSAQDDRKDPTGAAD